MIIDTLLLLLLVTVLALLIQLLRWEKETRARLQALRSETATLQTRLAESPKPDPGAVFAQLESYLYVRDRLDLRRGIPYTRDWSAAPDFLKLIADHCLEAGPITIVECSTGATTLVLARCCQANGRGRVVSLENGAEYAARSRRHIDRYGLGGHASVLHAPLEERPVDGENYLWYRAEGLPEGGIDMLVIDGPPGHIQRHSRYPAVPLLFDRLADGCVIFLDDAARKEEREIVELWLARYPGLSHQYLATERGCSILTLNKG